MPGQMYVLNIELPDIMLFCLWSSYEVISRVQQLYKNLNTYITFSGIIDYLHYSIYYNMHFLCIMMVMQIYESLNLEVTRQSIGNIYR